MNILVITPGINKRFNDNYHAYRYISDNDNNVLAISNKENIAKGGRLRKDPEIEVDGSLVIHRIFNSMREQQSFFRRLPYKKKVENLVSEFFPDVIFCEEISNLKLALEIKRKFRVPIVLRTEFAFDADYPYRSMGRLLQIFKNPLTGDRLAILVGGLIWRWAYANADAVISCYYEDAPKQPEVNNTPFYYVPWPTYYPNIEGEVTRVRDRAVFIGAFEPHKNLNELLFTIPKLLRKSPLKEFCVVGTGQDLSVIEQLKASYPESIRHFQSLSREECLKLIRDSFFSYSPATRGGWGFIGDSWAMGTPVVVTHNHYGFCDDVDSVVTSPQEIVNRVKSLYENEPEFERVRAGGYKRFLEHHTAQAVGSRFLEICALAVRSFH
jgi:glycosyltransferase involved in cell wall biosynthesis